MQKGKIKIDKNIKITLLILLVYLVVMLIIFLPGYLKSKYEKLYIVTNRYKIKYEDGSWKNIDKTEDYVLKNFEIYENNNYKGNYKIMLSNDFILLDEDNKKVDYDGIIFGHRGTLNLKYLSFTSIDDNKEEDTKYIDEVIKKIGMKDITKYSLLQKVEVENKVIYSVSNNNAVCGGDINSLDGIGYNPEDKFSVIFMVEDGKLSVIDKIIDNNDPNIYEVVDIFDIKEDNKLELLYSEKPAQVSTNECIKMYNMKNKKEINNFCK